MLIDSTNGMKTSKGNKKIGLAYYEQVNERHT